MQDNGQVYAREAEGNFARDENGSPVYTPEYQQALDALNQHVDAVAERVGGGDGPTSGDQRAWPASPEGPGPGEGKWQSGPGERAQEGTADRQGPSEREGPADARSGDRGVDIDPGVVMRSGGTTGEPDDDTRGDGTVNAVMRVGVDDVGPDDSITVNAVGGSGDGDPGTDEVYQGPSDPPVPDEVYRGPERRPQPETVTEPGSAHELGPNGYDRPSLNDSSSRSGRRDR
jgi:hypothetical protein